MENSTGLTEKQSILLDRILTDIRKKSVLKDELDIMIIDREQMIDAQELGISNEVRLALYEILFENGHLEKYGDASYKITGRGILFNQNSGYLDQQVLREYLQADREALKTLEKRLKEKAVVQNRWLIVIGAIVSIASLIDIVKFLYSYFHG